MSWETRGNNRYYYRRQRDESGGVSATYVGRGPEAEMIANLDSITRELPRWSEGHVGRLEEALDDCGDALAELEKLAEAFRTEAFGPLGFRRCRGEWRRSRTPATPTPKTQSHQ